MAIDEATNEQAVGRVFDDPGVALPGPVVMASMSGIVVEARP